MTAYEADLGAWERGIVVDIEAADEDDALKQAYRLTEQAEADGSLPANSIVVQMRRGQRCIYDYFNGFYARRSHVES